MEQLDANDPKAESSNLISQNIEKLKYLFPELVTEGPNGISVNVDVLKALVGDQTTTDADEKYGLNWSGKRQARQLALTPSTGTLRPCQQESLEWITTKHLMIEGDNLEVLKLLQKSYAGKVKLIYIDPPYNTGKDKDFVYTDDFRDNIQNYLELTGQVANGRRLTTNIETRGRLHTDWLNMMYPRLMLAQNLLRDDGVIFINIDDTEMDNLKKICSEIFGEENFIAHVVWQKKYSPQNDATYFSDMHDHILVYAKQAKKTKADTSGWSIDLLPRTKEQDALYKNPDHDARGLWMSSDLSVKTYSGKNDFPITTPSGRVVNPPQSTCWRVSREKFQELLADNRIWFGKDGNAVPRIKRFLSEVQDGRVPTTWWTYQECGHNQEAKQELKSLLQGADTVFDTPKPLRLLNRILELSVRSDPDAIVLDFFAGSGTLGQALIEFNSKDEGTRRSILIQLPEVLNDSSFGTIADLTKERLRRAAAKVQNENPSWKGDAGFRVFKLDSSNIRAWNVNPDNVEEALFENLDHIVEGRTEIDILYEVLLKLGLDLCVPIEQCVINDKSVYSVGGGVLLACLAESIEITDVEALAQGIINWNAALSPTGDVICLFRDSAFSNDVVKANIAAILNQHGLTNIRSL